MSTIVAPAEVSKKYELKSHITIDISENIVAYINTHLRLCDAIFQIFPGSTRNAHRSNTQNILSERAINTAK